MVAYYQQVGFIPAGVLNALVRIGWSYDDQTEILSLSEMISKFSLERVIRSPAGLDPDKLISFQSHWMHQLPAEQKLEGCLQWLQRAGLIGNVTDSAVRAYVASVVDLAGDRLRVYGDIFNVDEFFVADDALQMDQKNFEKRVLKVPAVADLLRQVQQQFRDTVDFTSGPLHDLLQNFLQQHSLKPGDLFPALRLCISGRAQGADLFRTLELLGRERVDNRLTRALSHMAGS
jgi:glutamyl-tRNA synthetase